MVFDPMKRRIEGIRCTYQLSPWLSDYGDATFFPYSGETAIDPSARANSYRPDDMHAHPHLLQMYLLRGQTKLELTPAEQHNG
jgi:putative alpha-1,2-mannosidase